MIGTVEMSAERGRWIGRWQWCASLGGTTATLRVRGERFERTYAPVLGPSGIVLARLLVQLLAKGGTLVAGVEALGAEVGLSEPRTEKAFGRLERFGLVSVRTWHVADVRLFMAPVGGARRDRLPPLAARCNAEGGPQW